MSKIPHLAFPFRVENGVVATVEQNSIEEVKQCVLACLSTALGTREEHPDYGIFAGLFEKQTVHVDLSAILRAVEEAEPRARLLARVELERLARRVLVGVDTGSANG